MVMSSRMGNSVEISASTHFYILKFICVLRIRILKEFRNGEEILFTKPDARSRMRGLIW